jgi:hypothetical protein
MNVWTRFQDPAWRKAAESRPQGSLGTVWHITKTDDKKTKQHKLKVKDWLFKSNLTEELLLSHPTPDDVKFFQDIRKLAIWDYFDPSDMAKLANIEKRVIQNRKSLTEVNLKTINDSISRAKRLQHHDIKRIGVNHGKEKYENYKDTVKKIYNNTK